MKCILAFAMATSQECLSARPESMRPIMRKREKNFIAVFHLRYSYFRWVEKSPQVAK